MIREFEDIVNPYEGKHANSEIEIKRIITGITNYVILMLEINLLFLKTNYFYIQRNVILQELNKLN